METRWGWGGSCLEEGSPRGPPGEAGVAERPRGGGHSHRGLEEGAGARPVPSRRGGGWGGRLGAPGTGAGAHSGASGSSAGGREVAEVRGDESVLGRGDRCPLGDPLQLLSLPSQVRALGTSPGSPGGRSYRQGPAPWKGHGLGGRVLGRKWAPGSWWDPGGAGVWGEAARPVS